MEKKWKEYVYTKDPDRMIARFKGRNYQEYRRKWKQAEKLKKAQDYPIHIDFELHYGCNLKCPQCILQIDPGEFDKTHPYYKEQKRQKISFDKFTQIINEGIKHGLKSVTLGVNNEPLMDLDIVKYIKYAARKGILDIIILTNGTLLTEKMSGELLDSGLTKLYFSVDAIREDTYKKIRTGGDLRKVMRNINFFLELKKQKKRVLPVTRVSYVKSKVNRSETDEFVRYWESRVDFVSLQAFISPAYGSPGYRKIKDMFQIKNADLKSVGPCLQPFRRLTIYHDGSVHPCCHWAGGTIIVGNIYDDTVYNIWNSKKMDDMRSSVNNLKQLRKECKICRELIFKE